MSVHWVKEILCLQEAELKVVLEKASAEELREIRAFIGHGKAGKRDENIAIIMAHVQGTSENLKSPEGRDDRHRSPKAGKAAQVLRSAAAKASSASGSAALAHSPTVAEFIGETTEVATSSTATTGLPSVGPLPGFKSVSDPKHAGQNTVIVTELSEAEIDAAKAGSDFDNMDDDSWADAARIAGPQAPPPLSTEIPDAPDGVDPSVWKAIGSMFDFKLQAVNSTLQTMTGEIEAIKRHAVSQNEMKPIHESLQTLSIGAVQHDQRIGKLESSVQAIEEALPNLNLGRPRVDWSKDKLDPAYKRVAFVGFDDADSITFRETKLNAFMRENFKDSAYAVGHEFKGGRKSGKLKPISYVEFINRDVSNAILSKIQADKYECTNSKGKKLTIDKAKTSVQKTRWYSMKLAEELVTKDPRTKAGGWTVSIDSKMPVRRVYVAHGTQKIAVFEQEKDDLEGIFTGDYEHLVLKKD